MGHSSPVPDLGTYDGSPLCLAHIANTHRADTPTRGCPGAEMIEMVGKSCHLVKVLHLPVKQSNDSPSLLVQWEGTGTQLLQQMPIPYPN